MRRSIRSAAMLAALGTCAFTAARAQQIGTNKVEGQPDTYTLSIKSQLVVETVVVKDKQGKSIDGLTARDFTVTEDGIPQTIRLTEHESLPTNAAPLPPADEENITIIGGSPARKSRRRSRTAPAIRTIASWFSTST